jgi:hypothetical protein
VRICRENGIEHLERFVRRLRCRSEREVKTRQPKWVLAGEAEVAKGLLGCACSRLELAAAVRDSVAKRVPHPSETSMVWFLLEEGQGRPRELLEFVYSPIVSELDTSPGGGDAGQGLPHSIARLTSPGDCGLGDRRLLTRPPLGVSEIEFEVDVESLRPRQFERALE